MDVISPIATRTERSIAPAASPLTVTLPEMNADLETPRPPAVSNVPVVLLVVSLVPVALKFEPTIEFDATK